MITPIKFSHREMSELMNIKSFQYIPVDMISNKIYQRLSMIFRVSVGVNGNDGFYNVINSGMKDMIITEVRRILVNKYYKKPTTPIFIE